ncbi:MAG: type II secretion system GspH family protein [Cetobacterium sp.]|nr:type II secretion system GspH family protein [Cetobacterium sp.]
MKNKGFTMVEIIVVLAIVGILSGFIVPKAQKQIGISKDLRAINILTALRTANSMFFLEKNNSLQVGDFTEDKLQLLREYLPEAIHSKIIIENGIINIDIGGKINQNNETIYGGKLNLVVDELGEIKFKSNFKNLNGEPWNGI